MRDIFIKAQVLASKGRDKGLIEGPLYHRTSDPALEDFKRKAGIVIVYYSKSKILSERAFSACYIGYETRSLSSLEGIQPIMVKPCMGNSSGKSVFYKELE